MLERNLRLEKVVTSKQLRLAVETEEERRARLENDAATKRLRLAIETEEERKTRLEKMVATTQLMLALIKGVVSVGLWLLSLKSILNKTLGRARDPHANGAWLSKLTERNMKCLS